MGPGGLGVLCSSNSETPAGENNFPSSRNNLQSLTLHRANLLGSSNGTDLPTGLKSGRVRIQSRAKIDVTSFYRVGQKRGHRLMTITLSYFNRFTFFTRRFLCKFAVKCILKVQPHLALPCETLMSAKQAINAKLQGSVATYLRCGGDLLRNLAVKNCKSVKI